MFNFFIVEIVCAIITPSFAILFIDKLNYIFINLDDIIKYAWMLDSYIPVHNTTELCNLCDPSSNTLYPKPKLINIYKIKSFNPYFTFILPQYLIKNIIISPDLL